MDYDDIQICDDYQKLGKILGFKKNQCFKEWTLEKKLHHLWFYYTYGPLLSS